jgi:sugar/nucleoside kinase (ribokinase family)
MRAACEDAARRVAEAGGTVAFDPNLRAELADPAEARALCDRVLRHARVVLPSGSEAELLTGEDDPRAGCRALLARGAELVVLKRGADGCTVFSEDGPPDGTDVPAPPAEVRDPTGAGDVFAAGLAVALLEGRSVLEAARFASAAAAEAIGTLGPMAGLADRAACARRLERP